MNTQIRRVSLYSLLWCLLTLFPAAGVLAMEIHLPAGDLATALQILAKQSGAEIMYATDQVKGIHTPEIRGDLTVEQAVRRLLDGTHLLLLIDSSGAMFITSGDNDNKLESPPLSSESEEAPHSENHWLGTPRIVELVVTARKREESLHRTPVIIQVLGQHDLERAQIHDLFTLAPRAPGFLIGDQNGVLGPGVTLRGVGTTAFNPMIDQSVSLNVDGLQLSQGFAYQAAMFDVGQVEVLKGPQALFFGKNSPAGVISLRSADPTDETEVILRTGYETVANEKVGELILSGPVSPSLKLRLATHFSDHDGYYRNRATAPEGFGVRSPTTSKFAARENWIVRGTALFEPSERYDARLKLNFTESQQDYSGGDTQVATCPGGLTSFTGIPFFDPNEDCRLNRDTYISWPDPEFFPLVRNNGVPFIDSRSEFGTLEQNFYFSDLTLTSVTGYYRYRQKQLGNGSGTSGAITIVSDNDFSNRQFTQELRLASSYASPVNFLVGAFYQDGRLVNQPRIYANTALGLPETLRHVIHEIDVESISAFGQLTWDINDSLELSGGARWTREKRDHAQYNVASAGIPVGPVVGPDSKLDSDNLSPEVTLAWRPTDELMLFGSYKRGFKSGSFDATSYIPPTTPLSFGDEEVEGFEVGLKTRLLAHRLSLNVAAYDYRYTDLQVGAMEVTPEGLNSLRTLNAASAKVRGVDLDATFSPHNLPGLTLRGAVSYNDARYGSFANATCGNNQTIAQGCNQMFNPTTGRFSAQNLSGKRLARAPEWSFNAGVDYEIPMDNGMALTFGGGVTYVSDFDTNIIRHRDFVQDAYIKTNARITLSGANDAWEVALVGSNLGDKITSAFCANANLNGGLIFAGQVSGAETGGPAGDDYAACSPERGREIWLRFTFRPFALMGR